MRFFVLFLFLNCQLASATPRVVTSIQPLQEITASIMRGLNQPEVIIKGHASVHHFAFKPSHMRLLQGADLVIWVDRHFESGFYRLHEILPDRTGQIELTAMLGLDGADGHIWYSPGLLKRCIDAISAALVEIDPANADRYRQNAAQLRSAIDQWREVTASQLRRLRPRIMTEHAFLQHFAQDFGLPPIASLRDHHDHHGGLHDLAQIEKSLRDQPVECLLSLEPAPSKLAQNLALKYQFQTLNITNDGDIDSEAVGILRRLEALSRTLAKCARENSE